MSLLCKLLPVFAIITAIVRIYEVFLAIGQDIGPLFRSLGLDYIPTSFKTTVVAYFFTLFGTMVLAIGYVVFGAVSVYYQMFLRFCSNEQKKLNSRLTQPLLVSGTIVDGIALTAHLSMWYYGSLPQWRAWAGLVFLVLTIVVQVGCGWNWDS